MSFFRGDLVGAEEHFARLSGFLDADGFRQVPARPWLQSYRRPFARGPWVTPILARERIAQAIAFARDSNSPYDLAFGRLFESWLSCWLREPQARRGCGHASVSHR